MVVVLAGSHCGTHTCACQGFPFLILVLAHILVTVLVGFAHFCGAYMSVYGVVRNYLRHQ